jgi:hypothetical protein
LEEAVYRYKDSINTLSDPRFECAGQILSVSHIEKLGLDT